MPLSAQFGNYFYCYYKKTSIYYVYFTLMFIRNLRALKCKKSLLAITNIIWEWAHLLSLYQCRTFPSSNTNYPLSQSVYYHSYVRRFCEISDVLMRCTACTKRGPPAKETKCIYLRGQSRTSFLSEHNYYRTTDAEVFHLPIQIIPYLKMFTIIHTSTSSFTTDT